MKDKDIYTNLLTLTKNLSTLLLHASMEASNEEVFDSFNDALNETVQLQHSVYKCMEESGFYQMQNVDEKLINQTQDKFSECEC